MKKLKVRIRGVVPLLLNNSQKVDTSNYYAKQIKAITSKRNRTDEENELLKKIEWFSCLYLNDKKQIIIPANNLSAMLLEGAKKIKMGKVFQAGAWVEEHALLHYDGPKDLEKLFEDKSFVSCVVAKIQKNAVMRCRPIFKEWSLNFEVLYFPDQVNTHTLEQVIDICSYSVGLGDWRPKYGRFEVV